MAGQGFGAGPLTSLGTKVLGASLTVLRSTSRRGETRSGWDCRFLQGILFGPRTSAHSSESGVFVVILALQALDAVHLGVDSLNVVRHVGRLLDGIEGSRPLSWKMMVTCLLSFER